MTIVELAIIVRDTKVDIRVKKMYVMSRCVYHQQNHLEISQGEPAS